MNNKSYALQTQNECVSCRNESGYKRIETVKIFLSHVVTFLYFSELLVRPHPCVTCAHQKSSFFSFLTQSWNDKLLPGESRLSLTKGNVLNIKATNDQPVSWNSSKVSSWTVNWQVYAARAQCSVTMSGNGRARKWTGSTTTDRRRGRRGRLVEKLSDKTWEEAEEAKDTYVFLMR